MWNKTVFFESIELKKEAETVAKRLGFFCASISSLENIGQSDDQRDEVYLLVSKKGVELKSLNLSLQINFSEILKKFKERNYFSKKNILLKACGLSLNNRSEKNSEDRENKVKVVWDLTTGLAQDTMLFASVGCKVFSFERSKLIFELLNEGLKRVEASSDWGKVYSNINLRCIDSIKFLSEYLVNASLNSEAVSRPLSGGLSGPLLDGEVVPKGINYPNVIYIDPMYPEKKKNALPKKGMQVFQKVLGHNEVKEDELLFSKALEFSGARVVIKRPLWLEKSVINGKKVSHSFSGKTVRYDMYMA